jgi:hypothetical protein
VLDEEQNQILAAVHVHIEEQDLRKPFSLVEDKDVTQEDKDFICRTTVVPTVNLSNSEPIELLDCDVGDP